MLSFLAVALLQAVPQPAPTPVAPIVSPESEDETEFFGLFDTDRDGTISKAEFDVVAAGVDAEAAKQDPSQKGQAAAGLATAFALMDQNRDGHITREEFRALTRAGQ